MLLLRKSVGRPIESYVAGCRVRRMRNNRFIRMNQTTTIAIITREITGNIIFIISPNSVIERTSSSLFQVTSFPFVLEAKEFQMGVQSEISAS